MKKGSTVSLKCQASGFPLPKVRFVQLAILQSSRGGLVSLLFKNISFCSSVQEDILKILKYYRFVI